MTDGRHALAEERSLALHSAVADRLLANPSLVKVARRRVSRWLQDGTVARAYAEAWQQCLALPVDQIAQLLVDTGERARQLRQTSPFAGVLDARTRWAIWRRVRSGAGAATAIDEARRGSIMQQIEADAAR